MNFISIFQITILSTIQIFLLAACGYFLVKIKIINEDGLSFLSKVVVNLLFPLYSFHQLTTYFDFQTYGYWWVFPLLSFVITIGGFSVGWAMTRIFEEMAYKKEFIALIGFQNSGYIPLILVTTMFAGFLRDQLSVYIFLFLIGFDLVIWSFGVWYLIRRQIETLESSHTIGMPMPIAAIIVSLALVALGLQHYLPQALMRPVAMLGNCALPIAAVVVGGNMAAIQIFGENRKKIALVVFTKLILFPTLAFLVILLFRPDPLIGFLIILQAAVPSANSLSVIARYYKIDGRFLNQSIFFTNLLSVFTLPFFLALYLTYNPLF